jgi:hypothetical protein
MLRPPWVRQLRSKCVGALLTLLAGLAAANAVRAADAPTPEQVTQLVDQLGKGSRRERTEAERKLFELGPDVLELLPPPDLVTNPSARATLGPLRKRLELSAAEQSLRIDPATIVGQFEAPEWAADLAKQTHNDGLLTVSEDSVGKITSDVQSLPFWAAIEAVGLSATYDVGLGVVKLKPRDPSAMPNDSSGLFRVAASATRRNDRILVELQIWGEPRIRPLYAIVRDGAIELRRGEMISKAASPEASRELAMPTRGPVTITVPFNFDVGESADLVGELKVKTATYPQSIAFDALSDPGAVSRRRGGVTVTRRGASKDESQTVSVGLSIAYDHGGPEFESHRLWLYHNEAWLETTDGKRLPAIPEIEALEEANGGLALVYRFPSIEQPLNGLRFVYVVPTRILDAPVPFRIKNLPIREGEQAQSPPP